MVLPGDEKYPGAENGKSTKGYTHRMIIGPNNSYKYLNGNTTLHSKL